MSPKKHHPKPPVKKKPIEVKPEKIEELIEQKLEKIIVQSQTAYIEHFSGPYPPPDILQKYNDIEPGAANRIITMAENQAEHRQSLEKIQIDLVVKRQKMDSRNSLWGLIFAFVIAIFGLGLTAYAISQGFEVISSILGSGVFLGLVGTFIYGSRKKKQNQAIED